MLTTSAQTLFTVRIALITHICLQQLTHGPGVDTHHPRAMSGTDGAPTAPARSPDVCANKCNDCEVRCVTQVTEKQNRPAALKGV